MILRRTQHLIYFGTGKSLFLGALGVAELRPIWVRIQPAAVVQGAVGYKVQGGDMARQSCDAGLTLGRASVKRHHPLTHPDGTQARIGRP
ncbi:hypothetical protein VTN77DRAFT_8324 [Rasamsonia byssochlamydoides]|uniref:uncharacterized protein n=1 Tax=Rasamsonia byssochlamydoides TaxID=89139 RepID=UPI0037425C9D